MFYIRELLWEFKAEIVLEIGFYEAYFFTHPPCAFYVAVRETQVTPVFGYVWLVGTGG